MTSEGENDNSEEDWSYRNLNNSLKFLNTKESNLLDYISSYSITQLKIEDEVITTDLNILKDLKNLKSIHLSNIQGKRGYNIHLPKNIESIHLSNFKIFNNLNFEKFSKLNYLLLNINYIKIKSFPTSLNYLSLTNSDSPKDVIFHHFDILNKLEYCLLDGYTINNLSIKNGKIHTLILINCKCLERDIHNNIQLKTLVIKNCIFTDAIFLDFINLNTLILNNNTNLNISDFFSSFSTCERVSLIDNKYDRDQDVLEILLINQALNNPKLKHFTLNDFQLKLYPKFKSNLITNLSLKNTNLCSLSLIKNLTNLTNLDCSYNNLDSKDIEYMQGLPIKKLNIQETGILEFDLLNKLVHLVELNISNSFISTISLPQNLEKINLSMCEFEDIQILNNIFPESIKNIILDDVSLNMFEFIYFPSSLRILSMENCNINEIFNFHLYENLETLNITNNNITELKLTNSLKNLYCCKNPIKFNSEYKINIKNLEIDSNIYLVNNILQFNHIHRLIIKPKKN